MTNIGRYIIEAELGAGAMGVVYLAVDPRLERRIALKTYRLPAGVAPEQKVEFQQRFLREACAAAALSHPGIVAVYDTGVDAEHDAPYIAMEFVAGSSLSELLAEVQRLPPERAFEIADTLAAALQVAHAAGIVHRDVKPANILIREADGAAKLADFGVARLATSELTRSGASLGSPAYMSPELIRGKSIDGRSDLFSLAVILYEMLSGERPFGGEDLTAVAYAIAHESPEPITQRVAGLPSSLDAFFDRALAKDPQRRFADGTVFQAELRDALRAPNTDPVSATIVPTPARTRTFDTEPSVSCFAGEPEPRSGHARRWIVVAGALLLLVGGWFLLRGDDVQVRLDARSSLPEGTLSIQVDGDEIYSRELSGRADPESAPAHRRFLNKVLPKQNQETFEAWLDVPAGKHEILAQVQPSGLRDMIVVDFESGEQRTLRLVAGRTLGTPLSIKID